jgi:hypothetical protein
MYCPEPKVDFEFDCHFRDFWVFDELGIGPTQMRAGSTRSRRISVTWAETTTLVPMCSGFTSRIVSTPGGGAA